MSKISVALCTYNGARFLDEQLESFTTQRRLPDELIIGDDCSTDETLEIIENFKKKSPFPVRLYTNEKNLGSTKNFERTIARCTGDIIFLSDQDDVWLPEKTAVMENEFDKDKNVGLVFSDANLIGENGDSLGLKLWKLVLTEDEKNKIKEDRGFEVLLRRNVITGATMAFRADLRHHFIPISTDKITNLIHDGWIALILSLYSKIKFVDKSLILYRQHGSQQIGVDWQREEVDILSSKFSAAAIFSKFSRKYVERIEDFDKSTKFTLEEIKRIEDTVDFLKSESSVELSMDTINKFADNSTSEKLDQIAHYKARISLPKNRLKRIYPILREILTGRYHLFSRGFYGIGRDIFENWK